MANNFDKFTCFFSQQQLQMLQKHLLLYISVFLLLFTNCKEDKGIKKPLPATIKTSLNIDYAKGFSIKNNGNFKVLTITNPWPKADKEALVEDEKLIIVQVNGKVRAKITIAADASKEAIEAEAKAQPNVQQFIDGKTIRKVIVVPGRLVNIVAN